MSDTVMRLVTGGLGLMLCAAPAVGEDSFGVKLMRPDSLVGWDHGEQAPSGWTITDGRLEGRPGCTPLLSGFSFGQFELRFGWSAGDGAAWEILLPEVPRGDGLKLALCEGKGCGRLADGRRDLAPGREVEPSPGKLHVTRLVRAERRLALYVDDVQVFDVALKPRRRFGLGLALSGGPGALAGMRVAEPAGRPMFNGRDFSGWWTPGNIEKWQVEGDEIVRLERAGDYLRSQKSYANFTLSLELKMKQGGNSGLGLRTPHDGWPSSDGMELQWYDRDSGLGVHDNLAIYGNVAPLAFNMEPEQWNRLVVKADGRMISAWLGGELVQHYNTLDHPELRHRNLSGWIGFQDHGAWIRLRNVSMLEAPAGTGLEAWSRLPARRATAMMVDRVMNPDTVAAEDGLRSGVATASPGGDAQGEVVLAELEGPGAVVRVARAGDDGRLAFYFDGEEEPRIDCRLSDLRGRLPQFSEDANPVVTCVTYKKGLKLVLREAGGNRVRVDYVTFPADCQLQTFVDRESGFPRSWLPAMIYHLQKFGWGATRKFEPLPLLTSEKKVIPPGQTVELLRADGAGVVEHVKLLADKGLLRGDDLWLEATVDGESTPAVAAPARFWFPALAVGGRWNNYLFFEQGGAGSMLAMPFGRGLVLSASNHGQKPIGGVGAELLVRPAGGKDGSPAACPTRLRGVFLPGGKPGRELLAYEGGGRLVGLVCQQEEDAEPGVASLSVDGRPVEGWAAPDLSLLVGQSGQFRSCLSGRQGGLCWRYLLLAPVEFRKSIALEATADGLGPRLALFYTK